MSIDFMNLSYGAIIVASVVRMAIGFTYYSPYVLGKTWMKLSDHKEEEGSNKWACMGWYFLVLLVIAVVFNALINSLGINTLMDGACLGFWIWLGFVATTSIQKVIFGKGSLPLFVLCTAEELISYVVMGGILAAMA